LTERSSNELPRELQTEAEPTGDAKKNRFPKRIGAVLLEKSIEKRVYLFHLLEPNLNFDQLACSHFFTPIKFYTKHI
jgi:hypothetical protein